LNNTYLPLYFYHASSTILYRCAARELYGKNTSPLGPIQDYLELNGDVADAVFGGCCWRTVIYRRATQRWQICNRSYSRYGHLTQKSVSSALYYAYKQPEVL